MEGKNPMHISSTFDSGNIEVVSISGSRAELNLRLEPFTQGTDKKQHSQWFYFRASNVKDRKCVFSILNAGGASYAQAYGETKANVEGKSYPAYQTAASYDRKFWFRVRDTKYRDADDEGKGGVLEWKITPSASTIWFAYWAPYTYERHQDLIARCVASRLVSHSVLGSTLDGRPFEMLTIGTGPRNVWIAARQHPGESMAEWCAEGVLDRLLDEKDPVAAQLRQKATMRIIPNMNPDGSVRGHLRTNACGANLNREWTSTGEYKAPSLERSPEVYYTLQALKRFGCDLYVDVHGDEEISANFFADTAGIPNWNPRLAYLTQQFQTAMARASRDFQVGFGYGSDEPGQANLAICADQVASRFECLAVTFEMPYKDCSYHNPEPECQWSPQRATKIGGDMLKAILDVVPMLRTPYDELMRAHAEKSNADQKS